MRIRVNLYAGLRKFAPEGKAPFEMDVPEGMSLADLISRLGIPAEKPKILLVNGRHADPGQVLAEGDEVALFPPVAGG